MGDLEMFDISSPRYDSNTIKLKREVEEIIKKHLIPDHPIDYRISLENTILELTKALNEDKTSTSDFMKLLEKHSN